ncbi:MAG: S-layer homology domain-containing protein [Actinomycetota bacterium]
MAILLSVFTLSAGISVAPAAGYGGFSDVSALEYYATAVAWMSQEDITTGTEPGCFSPDDTTTRGQAMTFLWRYEGEPSGYSHSFVDINSGYQNAPVAWGQSTGVTTGVSSIHFQPDQPVTRADAVVFLWRLAGMPTAGIPYHGFTDVVQDYQHDAISWARDRGITTGVSNSRFEPNDSVTRAEISTFIWRYAGQPSVSNPPLDESCGLGNGDAISAVSLGLSSANTGLAGGQNQGICSQSPRAFNGNLTINQNWLNNNNNGSKVLSNFRVDGSIVVAVDNVTFRCGEVVGSATYTVDNRARGTAFEWFRAHGYSSGKTILGGNYTAYRCDVSGGEDSIHINTGAVTITECYIHDQNYTGNDPHPDAIQATSGGSVQSVVVERSKLISFYKAPNAALQINVANYWSITESYLWGGLYSILGDPGNPGQAINNFFAWDAAKFGAIGGVSSSRSGNVWWEWISPRCSGVRSAPSCNTPSSHPGNGTPI